MGIEAEVDRTLYIRNLDPRVTEELLFELFLQAGPLIKVIIPKNATDAQRKTFAFALYKHEVSVPYAMQLLNGTPLFGRKLSVQFRSGSKHGIGNSPVNPQNSVPANTPNPHGQRTPVQLNSPPYTPSQLQRSFSSPDNLQKHVTMNNMMLQLHMQQLEQLNSAFCKPLQRQPCPGGNGGGSWQHDNPYRHHPSQMNSGGRNQRYGDEPGSGRHRDSYHHQNDRSGSRHYDNRGSNRHHDDRGGNRNYQDGRWRKY